MDANDCGRELALYENIFRGLFLRRFIIYVEGHKNSIFADKGHSTWSYIFSKKQQEVNFVFLYVV